MGTLLEFGIYKVTNNIVLKNLVDGYHASKRLMLEKTKVSPLDHGITLLEFTILNIPDKELSLTTITQSPAWMLILQEISYSLEAKTELLISGNYLNNQMLKKKELILTLLFTLFHMLINGFNMSLLVLTKVSEFTI